MTYQFKYIDNTDKLIVLERRQKTLESDLYEFQLKLIELEQAQTLDTELMANYNAIVSDKLAQIAVLESLISELGSN